MSWSTSIINEPKSQTMSIKGRKTRYLFDNFSFCYAYLLITARRRDERLLTSKR